MSARRLRSGAYGQQPVWPRTRWAPQQMPGEVCEKARRQSRLKQQSLQPCDASERWLAGSVTADDAAMAASRVVAIAATIQSFR